MGRPPCQEQSFRTLSYIFAQFNLRDPTNPSRPHPIFGNRELRRALTMATVKTRMEFPGIRPPPT